MIKSKREKAKQRLRQTRVAVLFMIALGLPFSGWLMIRAFQIAGADISPTCVLLCAIWVLLAGLYLFVAHLLNYMDYKLITDEMVEEDAANKNDSHKTTA
jgi:hypothetical protein